MLGVVRARLLKHFFCGSRKWQEIREGERDCLVRDLFSFAPESVLRVSLCRVSLLRAVRISPLSSVACARTPTRSGNTVNIPTSALYWVAEAPRNAVGCFRHKEVQ